MIPGVTCPVCEGAGGWDVRSGHPLTWDAACEAGRALHGDWRQCPLCTGSGAWRPADRSGWQPSRGAK
jgi:hypothetical protein